MKKTRLSKAQFNKIVRLNVAGQTWRDAVNGNTYNSSLVKIELKDGREFSFIFGFTYGYGDYYRQRVCEWLATIAPLSLLSDTSIKSQSLDLYKLGIKCDYSSNQGLKRELYKKDDLSALAELIKI